MLQLSATRCSCIAILLVSLVSFAAITLCVASQRVFIVVSVYFIMDSVRKLFDKPSYDGHEAWMGSGAKTQILMRELLVMKLGKGFSCLADMCWTATEMVRLILKRISRKVTNVRVAQSVQRLGYRLDDRGSIHGRGKDGIFSLRYRVHTQPPIQRVPGSGGEADHSPPCSSRV
jgi:hypothetical protein